MRRRFYDNEQCLAAFGNGYEPVDLHVNDFQGGYITSQFRNVSITIKLHSPLFLASQAVLATQQEDLPIFWNNSEWMDLAARLAHQRMISRLLDLEAHFPDAVFMQDPPKTPSTNQSATDSNSRQERSLLTRIVLKTVNTVLRRPENPPPSSTPCPRSRRGLPLFSGGLFRTTSMASQASRSVSMLARTSSAAGRLNALRRVASMPALTSVVPASRVSSMARNARLIRHLSRASISTIGRFSLGASRQLTAWEKTRRALKYASALAGLSTVGLFIHQTVQQSIAIQEQDARLARLEENQIRTNLLLESIQMPSLHTDNSSVTDYVTTHAFKLVDIMRIATSTGALYLLIETALSDYVEATLRHLAKLISNEISPYIWPRAHRLRFLLEYVSRTISADPESLLKLQAHVKAIFPNALSIT